MTEYIAGILLLFSAFIILIASIGIVRFKSLYTRMHVVTKVSSFAFLLLLIAINIIYFSFKVLIITIVVFHILIFLSPISAHIVAKVSNTLNQEEKKESK
ncbi:MAG TPA: monovalent cation/H(+) antiporter subunit G [Bacteroidales bacterium]|nr:monovalent cation/H(+) antiporter subunit G [Bacteroidales bacterium]